MGHAGVTVINSSESVFINRDGLVYLEDKISISAGVNGVFSSISYQNTATGDYVESESPMGTRLYLYASYKANGWLSVGLGVYTPYGSEVKYEKGWVGSHLVNSIKLQAIDIQPTVSIKLNDMVRDRTS